MATNNGGGRVGRIVLALVRWGGWRELLARLPLPMLALAASWGVYSFATWFVPVWVAIVTASAFELVYIGLAVVRLSPQLQKRARSISLGAVAVSMAYNTIDGLFHLRPSLFDNKPLWADISLALLHGVPLALLAYLVADLLLHTSHEVTARPKADLSKLPGDLSKSPAITDSAPTISTGRPIAATLEDLLSTMKRLGPETSRADLVEAMGVSGAVIDRLLVEGLDGGAVERVTRGVYRVKGGK